VYSDSRGNETVLHLYTVNRLKNIVKSDFIQFFNKRYTAFTLTDVDNPRFLELAHNIPDNDRISAYAARQKIARHLFAVFEIIDSGNDMYSYRKSACNLHCLFSTPFRSALNMRPLDA
jgi:hypothetical protein